MSLRMTSRTVLMAASSLQAALSPACAPYPGEASLKRALAKRDRSARRACVRRSVDRSLLRGAGRTYVRAVMERRYELESLRRSLAMLRPGAPALDREEAMRLVRELQDLEHQLRGLREGLQRLLAQSG